MLWSWELDPMKSQECLCWQLSIIAGCPTSFNEELQMWCVAGVRKFQENVLWSCWGCRVICHHDRVMLLYLFQVISQCIFIATFFYLLQTTVVMRAGTTLVFIVVCLACHLCWLPRLPSPLSSPSTWLHPGNQALGFGRCHVFTLQQSYPSRGTISCATFYIKEFLKLYIYSK